MITGHNTSFEWQCHPGDICVLPIGSVEQHAEHMPLLTDCIFADYFARTLAADLGAALLPVQPYGNCLEHSGFRGSVSLKPETLMQIVRDIADEMERQQFKIMVIVNGHGGNFALVPAVRDINRMDRPIKILLIDFWIHADRRYAVATPDVRAEIHAGEWELSLFMAIAPEYAKKPFRRSMPPAMREEFPLQRHDLTTFGTGHFNPDGSLGNPYPASSAKGRAILASIRKRLTPFVRDRIARLRKMPAYAGAGGIIIRAMVEQDIPAAMRLKNDIGGNQTEDDWRRFMALAPGSCLVAVRNGLVIGSVSTVKYRDRTGWIGLLVVLPSHRGIGIGTMLLKAAMKKLAACSSVMLDATAAGKPLYEKAGFRSQFTIDRMLALGVNKPRNSRAAQPIRPADLRAAISMDAKMFGIARGDFLKAIYSDAPHLAWQIRRQGRLAGFCLGRRGVNDYLGPLIAENLEDALMLASAAFNAAKGSNFIVDVPSYHIEFRKWMEDNGFALTTSFTRMYFGKPLRNLIERQFLIAGHEVG